MKEIIENKIYDTEEARYIGSRCNEYPPGSELYEKEELYQCYGVKRFFLACTGGARSGYCDRVNGERIPGEHIVPLNSTAAKKWGARYLDIDTYLLVFYGM